MNPVHAIGVHAKHLKSVKEFDPPPEVEAKVDEFLEAIVSAENPFQWQQNLSIGFNCHLSIRENDSAESNYKTSAKGRYLKSQLLCNDLRVLSGTRTNSVLRSLQ